MRENQSTFKKARLKRLPNVEKACIMPWDVLEKKRADRTFACTPVSQEYYRSTTFVS